jgi:aminopeptidase YwaD
MPIANVQRPQPSTPKRRNSAGGRWQLGIVCALLVSSSAAAHSGRDTITQASVRAHLEFLASDALNGRGSGTRDEWLAAEYIGSQLRLWGLEPLGDNRGYVQTIDIERTQLAGPPVLTFGAGGFTHGAEILVGSMSAVRHSGALVRFKEGNPTTAAAVLMPAGTTSAELAAITDAAILLVPETPQARSQWPAAASRPVSLGTRFAAAPATDTTRPARVTLDKPAYASFAALPEGTTISLEGQAAAPARTQTWNAVGLLKGRDSVRASEAILLSAHLDHLGNRPPRGGIVAAADADTLYNGADDDASGCVAVMELARAISTGKRPRRTIIFAFFGSEEAGGHGSRYFAEKSPVPLTQIVANLQFEMIGRPDPAVPPRTLWLTGYERSNLGPSFAKRGARLVQDPHPAQNFFFRSDNIRFARLGVVAHTVSSYGLHEEYHTPEDETRFVDYRHMTDAIRSMVKPIEWLANSTFRPEWLPGKKP